MLSRQALWGATACARLSSLLGETSESPLCWGCRCRGWLAWKDLQESTVLKLQVPRVACLETSKRPLC